MFYPNIAESQYVQMIYGALQGIGLTEEQQKTVGRELGEMYNGSWVYDDPSPTEPATPTPSNAFRNRVNAYCKQWAGLADAMTAWEGQNFSGDVTSKESTTTTREKNTHDESQAQGEQKTTFNPINTVSSRTSDAQNSEQNGTSDGTETETTDYQRTVNGMTPTDYMRAIKTAARTPSPVAEFCNGFSLLLLSPWEISGGCMEE